MYMNFWHLHVQNYYNKPFSFGVGSVTVEVAVEVAVVALGVLVSFFLLDVHSV